MNRTQHYALALAVLITVATVGVAPAVATHEDDTDDGSFVDGLVSEQCTWTEVACLTASNTGKLSKWYADLTTDTDGETADQYAADLQQEFNAESADLQALGNDELDASTSRDVFRVCLNDQQDGHAERYVVSNISNGDWTDTRMVNQSTFDSLNRSVDHNVSLDWYASRNAADELEAFDEKFADDRKNVSKTYHAKMVAEYGDSVQSDLWGQSPENCPA